MTADARRISLASPARLFDEVVKLFLSGSAKKCWQLLSESGIAAAIFPDFYAWLTKAESRSCLESLSWIDEAVASKMAVSPALLLAMFFSDYLAEKGEGLLCRGDSFQARLDGSLALFMEELGGRLFIPQRTVMRLREILLLQQRLLKTPGRKPENVISRPGFGEALEYLRFWALHKPAFGKTVHWWEHLHTTKKPVPVDDAESSSGEAKRRKRSHRRRRRPKPA
jgi:poly(A) polymerase